MSTNSVCNRVQLDYQNGDFGINMAIVKIKTSLQEPSKYKGFVQYYQYTDNYFVCNKGVRIL